MATTTNAYFGDYLAITNLTADSLGHISSYSYMRYEEPKLNIQVQFQRDSNLPWFWLGLYVKYKLIFEDDSYISTTTDKWIETSFTYESDTAYASFSIEFNKFLPLKSLEIWGKRPQDKDESDIKKRTYIFSEMTILKELKFNANNNLEPTEYSPYYQNIIKPSRFGSLVSSPILRGTSKEQITLMEAWHDGYLAIYPSKVKYLGEERYATFSVGLANSSSTESGTFMKTELFTFTPNEEKWYYFKIPDYCKNSTLSYPLIIYRLGDYIVYNYWTSLGSISIRHLSNFYYELNRNNITSNLQSIIKNNIEEEIIEINGELKKNYGILSVPTLSGFFQLPNETLPYAFKEGEIIPFSISTIINGIENIEEGGSLLYNKNQNTLSINKEPNFKKTKIWLYPKEDIENEINPMYRDKDCTLKLQATNLFTGLEEEISCQFSFAINKELIIFPEAVQIFTSLQDREENELINDLETLTSYNEELVFSQSTFILNPYEKLSYQIDSNYIYFPYLYCYGYNKGDITCRIYEQITDEEKASFVFPEEATFSGKILRTESEKILRWSSFNDTLICFKSYDDYISNLDVETIKVLENQTEIKSLIYSHFVKIGLGISWSDDIISSDFISSDIFELKTVRLGRTLPFQFNESKQSLSSKKIVYSLADYGGDKTLKKNYNTSVNSLLRSGKEKIEFSLNNEQYEIGILTIDSSMFTASALATLFLENVKREIVFPPSALIYNEGYSEDNLIEVTKIIGKYYYGFSGANDYQVLDFIITDAIVLQEKNPTVSFRKGGVIINGESGKKLTPVIEDEKEVGQYFIEINALSLKDRIIIQFGGAKGEIYYNSSKNKIILEGFELG